VLRGLDKSARKNHDAERFERRGFKVFEWSSG